MKNKLKKLKKFLAGVFYISVILISFTILFFSASYIYFARDLPRPEDFTGQTISRPTRIYDRTGEELLYTIHGEERREPINIKEVPDHFINALLAAEDSKFYEHPGFDVEGIGRAVLTNLREGDLSAGGSTISQQLIRSSLLTRDKTFMRKFRELILTVELERQYSKEEILELYLNQISFGHNIYGVETAAQSYFDKKTSELTPAESATLVAMIRSPSALSPYGSNKNRLLGRRNYVINRMADLGYLSEKEREEALDAEHDFSRFRNYLKAPHFVMEVKKQLENTYGEEFLANQGLKVYTTLDYEIQQKSERVAKLFADQNKEKYNAHNIAIVIKNPNTGEILSMVGSADYFGDKYPSDCIAGQTCLFDPNTNVALTKRQPGSAFKPFVYAKAFQEGYNGSTTVIDEEKNFGTPANPYIPKNYDNKFRGEVTLRQSLAQSLNVPSVKVLDDMAGLEESIELAENFGITTFDRDPYFYGLSLVLGGGEVKLLEMVSAYGVFANEGTRTTPGYIKKIEGPQGETFMERNVSRRRVIESSVAKEINDILSDNEARAPMFGENSILHFEDEEVMAKTGSTQNFRDGWAIGYTSDIVVGVWTGNNNNRPMGSLSLSVAGPPWRVLMENLLYH